MNAVRTAFREFIGLFVDDGSLALFVVVLIALGAGGGKESGLPPLCGGAARGIGCLALLIESLYRVARARG